MPCSPNEPVGLARHSFIAEVVDVSRVSAPGVTGVEVGLAASLISVLGIVGYRTIGLPPVIIVGGSGIAGLFFWVHTSRFGPVPADIVLPPFLLTVAALEVHMVEEWLTGFGPAMSRLFAISWTENSFLIVFAFAGPVLYSLTALALFRRMQLAGFIAWFIFIGPGLAEASHFLFPLIRPALGPEDARSLTAVVGRGVTIVGMPNYWIGVTGRYYFPGMATAVLPMIPGIWGIRSILAWRKKQVGSCVV